MVHLSIRKPPLPAPRALPHSPRLMCNCARLFLDYAEFLRGRQRVEFRILCKRDLYPRKKCQCRPEVVINALPVDLAGGDRATPSRHTGVFMYVCHANTVITSDSLRVQSMLMASSGSCPSARILRVGTALREVHLKAPVDGETRMNHDTMTSQAAAAAVGECQEQEEEEQLQQW